MYGSLWCQSLVSKSDTCDVNFINTHEINGLSENSKNGCIILPPSPLVSLSVTMNSARDANASEKHGAVLIACQTDSNTDSVHIIMVLNFGLLFWPFPIVPTFPPGYRVL